MAEPHSRILFEHIFVSRKQIATVNWERKRSQTASGARLRLLRRRWAQLVSDNYRIERAIMQLEIQLQKVIIVTLSQINRKIIADVQFQDGRLNRNNSVII